MSALVQYPQFDIKFAVLNDLAKRLRTAGAKISVRKVGEKHRVTVLTEPKLATVEQIIIYTMGRTNASKFCNPCPARVLNFSDQTKQWLKPLLSKHSKNKMRFP